MKQNRKKKKQKQTEMATHADTDTVRYFFYL